MKQLIAQICAKIKQSGEKANVPLILLSAFTIRTVFLDISVSASIFGVTSTGLYAFNMWMDTKRTKSLDQSVKEELEEIKSAVTSLSLKAGVKTSDKPTKRFF